MANRDPKTGRWVKADPKPEQPEQKEEQPKMEYEFFDDLPKPPEDQDYDIMMTFIYVIVIFALIGLACVFFSYH